MLSNTDPCQPGLAQQLQAQWPRKHATGPTTGFGVVISAQVTLCIPPAVCALMPVASHVLAAGIGHSGFVVPCCDVLCQV
jgi:hypothetical protein